MSWWKRLVFRGRMEAQLDKELRFHIDQHVADLVARGHLPDDAQRLARLALGGPEQVKEDCRDARGTRWLEDLWRDTRYALRTLRQRPAFAAVALLTLALGTGAATVMFTVIHGVLLKPLPYHDPGRLLLLQERTEQATQWGNLWGFTYPNYVDVKRAVRSLAMAVWRYDGGAVSKPGAAEYVDGAQVSSELFSVLGVKIPQGRAFLPDDDRPGAAPVAIISHGLWQRRFAANPEAIGAQIVFDGQTYTVVGIAPAGLRISDLEFDVFVPLGLETSPVMQNREAHAGFRVWARHWPGRVRNWPWSGANSPRSIQNPMPAARSLQILCAPKWAMWARRYGCCWARSRWCS